jgi:hypothetical protein
MNALYLKRTLKLVLWMFIFMVVLNQLIGWAVTEKTWLEKLMLTLTAGGVFGAVGAGVGLVIGGIGIAVFGTAFGIPGVLACGLLGFGLGGWGGSLYTILQSPQDFTFDYFRLVLVVGAAATAGAVAVLSATAVGRWLRSRISSNNAPPEATKSAT